MHEQGQLRSQPFRLTVTVRCMLLSLQHPALPISLHCGPFRIGHGAPLLYRNFEQRLLAVVGVVVTPEPCSADLHT